MCDYNRLWKNEWTVGTEIGPSIKTRIRIVKKLINKYVQSGSILDIGCGSGRLWSSLRNKGRMNILAIDISGEAVRQARESGLAAMKADVTVLETLPQEEFDAITCVEALEHIEKDQIALGNISKLLKRGGYLFITVPHLMKYWTKNDEFYQHVRRYNRGELVQQLVRCNFEILENFTWGGLFYKYYYLMKGELNQETIFSTKGMWYKRVFSIFLFFLFRIEDLVSVEDGVNLFIVAKKK